MDVELWKENFKKNFFYGMDAKDEIIEYIILKKADEISEVDMKTVDTKLYKVEYTIEQIKKIIVQIARFVGMNEPSEKQNYFYQKIGMNDIEIEQQIEEKIEELKRKDIIAGVIKNYPSSALYITGGQYHKKYPGKEYYNSVMQKPVSIWMEREVMPILETLCTLEQENKAQYYALFLDTKYNRAIHAQQQLKEEQEYLESLPQDSNTQKRIEEIKRIRAVLPKQIEEIKKVFSQFMNAVKLPKQDILAGMGQEQTAEMQKYIKQNFSDYQTISTLKQEATDETYQKRLQKKIQELKDKQFESIR